MNRINFFSSRFYFSSPQSTITERHIHHDKYIEDKIRQQVYDKEVLLDLGPDQIDKSLYDNPADQGDILDVSLHDQAGAGSDVGSDAGSDAGVDDIVVSLREMLKED